MTKLSERILTVNALVDWNEPIAVLKEELARFPWDYAEGNPVVWLGPEEVLSALQAVIEGNETSADLEEWANLIELRDDIDYEDKYAELIKQVIHELANPTLYEAISTATCRSLVDRIRTQF